MAYSSNIYKIPTTATFHFWKILKYVFFSELFKFGRANFKSETYTRCPSSHLNLVWEQLRFIFCKSFVTQLSHLVLVLHATEGDWKSRGSETKQSRSNIYQFSQFVCYCRRPPDGRCSWRRGGEVSWKENLKTWLTAGDRGSSKLLGLLETIFVCFSRRLTLVSCV